MNVLGKYEHAAAALKSSIDRVGSHLDPTDTQAFVYMTAAASANHHVVKSNKRGPLFERVEIGCKAWTNKPPTHSPRVERCLRRSARAA